METFLIEIPNDVHPYRVEAATWVCSTDFHLTAFNDEGNEIDTWAPTEWFRLIEQSETGKPVDKFRNPLVPNPKRR
ncbi:hypothetical protein [Arthrobacter sp. R4-81]